MNGDIGTVGITQFAADALGDVVFVDLPQKGAKYAAGDSFGSVESVKAASDVYVPVSGEILEVNNVRFGRTVYAEGAPIRSAALVPDARIACTLFVFSPSYALACPRLDRTWSPLLDWLTSRR